MQEKIKILGSKLTEKWNTLEKGQQIRLGAIAAMVFVVTCIAIFMATRPQMVILRAGLDWSTTAQIQEALLNNGISSTPNAAGSTISVNARDATFAEAILAQQNIRPGTNIFTFQDILSNTSVGTSDRMTRESLLRAREADIIEALRTINGIDDAQVTIVPADDTIYWLENYENASVGVMLTTNANFARGQGEAIARFVTANVRGLDMRNLEIIDQNSNVIFSGSAAENSSFINLEMELRASRESDIETQIRALLGPMYSDIQVMSSLSFDMDATSLQTHTFAPHDPEATQGLPTSVITERSSAENVAAGAEPGMILNEDGAPMYQFAGAGQNSIASANSSATQFIYNETLMQRESTPGQLLRDQSSVAVIAYRFNIITEEYVRRNGLLEGLTWEEFQRVNSEPVELEVSETVLELLRTGTGIQDLEFMRIEQSIFVPATSTPVQVEQVIILTILAVLIFLLAYGLIKNSRPDEIIEIEPELSVEDLLVTTQLEESEEISELERMRNLQIKESETKRQIEKFVDEKPEAVAQLLRNWLNDEWE